MLIEKRKAVGADKAVMRAIHHEAFRDVVTKQFGQWDENLQDRFFEVAWKPDKAQIESWDGKTAGYLIVDILGDCIRFGEIVLAPGFKRPLSRSNLRKYRRRTQVHLPLHRSKGISTSFVKVLSLGDRR